MEKKIYIAPETEFLAVQLTSFILTASDPFDDEERGDSGSSANETVGGSWENIWNE